MLEQDGYPTPEQIGIFLPGDSFPDTMTATMRYHKVGVETWTTGHDLFHVTAGYARKTYDPGFAWTITGLDQGSIYLVEVTTHDGARDVVYTETMSTSSLPAAAGAVTTTITAGSTESQIETILNAAQAGDVIQFENGTYNTETLQIKSSGVAGNPIYIRGESRDGVIISDPVGNIVAFSENEYVVLENLTIQGSGVDNGSGGGVSFGISYWDGYGSPAELIGNITDDISDVNHVAIEMSENSTRVYDSSEQLDDISKRLKNQIDRFKTE